MFSAFRYDAIKMSAFETRPGVTWSWNSLNTPSPASSPVILCARSSGRLALGPKPQSQFARSISANRPGNEVAPSRFMP